MWWNILQNTNYWAKHLWICSINNKHFINIPMSTIRSIELLRSLIESMEFSWQIRYLRFQKSIISLYTTLLQFIQGSVVMTARKREWNKKWAMVFHWVRIVSSFTTSRTNNNNVVNNVVFDSFKWSKHSGMRLSIENNFWTCQTFLYCISIITVRTSWLLK